MRRTHRQALKLKKRIIALYVGGSDARSIARYLDVSPQHIHSVLREFAVSILGYRPHRLSRERIGK